MTKKFAACPSCGSTSSPQGSRFCCDCGQAFETHEGVVTSADEQIPFVAAVPIEDNGSIATAPAVIQTTSSTTPLDHPPAINPAVAIPPSIAPTARTVSNDHEQDIPVPSVAQVVIDEPATSTVTGEGQQQQQEEYGNNDGAAIYWKNPPSQLLAHAKRKKSFVGILGGNICNNGANNSSRIVVPKKIEAAQVLGSMVVDLSHADFVYPVTSIDSGTVLGELKIIVPRGVRVENHGVSILAETKIQAADNYIQEDAPLIILKGATVLGSTNVRVNNNVPPLRVIQGVKSQSTTRQSWRQFLLGQYA